MSWSLLINISDLKANVLWNQRQFCTKDENFTLRRSLFKHVVHDQSSHIRRQTKTFARKPERSVSDDVKFFAIFVLLQNIIHHHRQNRQFGSAEIFPNWVNINGEFSQLRPFVYFIFFHHFSLQSARGEWRLIEAKIRLRSTSLKLDESLNRRWKFYQSFLSEFRVVHLLRDAFEALFLT